MGVDSNRQEKTVASSSIKKWAVGITPPESFGHIFRFWRGRFTQTEWPQISNELHMNDIWSHQTRSVSSTYIKMRLWPQTHFWRIKNRDNVSAVCNCRSLPLAELTSLHKSFFIIIFNWLRQTAQPYTRDTTYNSLPRRAAMTRHTDCHAGQ